MQEGSLAIWIRGPGEESLYTVERLRQWQTIILEIRIQCSQWGFLWNNANLWLPPQQVWMRQCVFTGTDGPFFVIADLVATLVI
jgi:hypothetical protein